MCLFPRVTLRSQILLDVKHLPKRLLCKNKYLLLLKKSRLYRWQFFLFCLVWFCFNKIIIDSMEVSFFRSPNPTADTVRFHDVSCWDGQVYAWLCVRETAFWCLVLFLTVEHLSMSLRLPPSALFSPFFSFFSPILLPRFLLPRFPLLLLPLLYFSSPSSRLSPSPPSPPSSFSLKNMKWRLELPRIVKTQIVLWEACTIN